MFLIFCAGGKLQKMDNLQSPQVVLPEIELGADIVEIVRIEKLLLKYSNFFSKIFTEREISYYSKTGSRTETLAGIFACKEAMVKAIGGRISQYEILHYENGKPYVLVDGYKISATITHDKTVAAAFVCAMRYK